MNSHNESCSIKCDCGLAVLKIDVVEGRKLNGGKKGFEERVITPTKNSVIEKTRIHPMRRTNSTGTEHVYIAHVRVKCNCGKGNTHLIEQNVYEEERF